MRPWFLRAYTSDRPFGLLLSLFTLEQGKVVVVIGHKLKGKARMCIATGEKEMGDRRCVIAWTLLRSCSSISDAVATNLERSALETLPTHISASGVFQNISSAVVMERRREDHPNEEDRTKSGHRRRPARPVKMRGIGQRPLNHRCCAALGRPTLAQIRFPTEPTSILQKATHLLHGLQLPRHPPITFIH